MFIVTVVLNLNLNSKPRPQSLYCTLKHLNGVWVPRKGIMQKMWHYPLLAHSNEKSFQITMTAVHLLVLLLFLLFLHRGASGASDETKIHTLHRSECCFHSNIFLSLSYYEVFVVVAQDCFLHQQYIVSIVSSA